MTLTVTSPISSEVMAIDGAQHEAQEAHSQKLLKEARDAAHKKSHYNSAETRTTLQTLFKARCGLEPYNWQLDVTEAMLLGLDSVVIAGTGSGKTIPFMLPLLLHARKMILILSPLKVLQQDQVQRFKKMKISAVAVNGETWSPSLAKSLNEYKYQAIFTSPEMCLKHPDFRKWLVSTETSKKMLSTIVDEAHCISQWGGDFRPAYAQLEKLRAIMPSNLPILLTSATLPPDALSDICTRMNINRKKSFLLNRGNHRPNITTSIIHIDGSQDFCSVLAQLPLPNDVMVPQDFPKTLIFTNSVNLTQILCREIRKHYANQFNVNIDFLHANRTAKAKRRVMKRFRKGLTRILIATEAAGMGADIPDIEQIFQFGVPASLSIWNQRYGRAGRSSNMKARAILLVEKSMFKRKKRRKPGGSKRVKKPDESSSDSASGGNSSDSDAAEKAEPVLAPGDDGKEWGKKVDDNLRKYIVTTGCRTAFSDLYFNNPPRITLGQHVTNCDTCDNCAQTTMDTEPNARPTTPDPHPMSSPTSSPCSSPLRHPNPINETDKLTPTSTHTVKGPSIRRKEHLKNARTLLEDWRVKKHLSTYSPSPIKCSVLLPDAVITTLASNRRIRTIEDLNCIKPPWIFASLHGQEVLDMLARLDKEEAEERERKKLEKREERKRVTAERQKAARESKRLEREEVNLAKKASRKALAGSTGFNSTIVSFPLMPLSSPVSPAYLHSTPQPPYALWPTTSTPSYLPQQPPFSISTPVTLNLSQHQNTPPLGVFSTPLRSSSVRYHPYASNQLPLPQSGYISHYPYLYPPPS